MRRQAITEWVSVAALGALALALRLGYIFQVKDTALVVAEDLRPVLDHFFVLRRLDLSHAQVVVRPRRTPGCPGSRFGVETGL